MVGEMMEQFDAGDKDAVKKRKATSLAGEERRVEGLKQLMRSKDGRRYVWWLLEQTHLYQPSFHQSNAQTAFNEGERYIGLKLMADINMYCAGDYRLMEDEAKEGK